MRDYLLWRGSDKRPVADWPTDALHAALAQIMQGKHASALQCSAEQMAERIRIELSWRAAGGGG